MKLVVLTNKGFERIMYLFNKEGNWTPKEQEDVEI